MSQVNKHTRVFCDLVNLYRSFFGGAQASQDLDQSCHLLKSNIRTFQTDFKIHAAARKLQQEEQATLAASAAAAQLEEDDAAGEQDDDSANEAFEVVEPVVETPKPPTQRGGQQKKSLRLTDLEDDFEEKKSKAQRKADSRPSTHTRIVTEQPKSPPKYVASFTPRTKDVNLAKAPDGFETYNGRKRRFYESQGSDSDDDRIPHTLLIRLSQDWPLLKRQLAQGIDMIPQSSLDSSILKDNVTAIKSLLASKNLTGAVGWEYPNDLSITCMFVNRDEEAYEESDLAMDFVRDKDVVVTISALLLAPGKAVIGIAAVDDQDVEDKVPSLPLLLNDLKQKN